MSLPRVTNTLGTVSQLDDRPNDTGGLTAAELKAKFDKDSETLKTFLNNRLIPYLESSAAAGQLGIQTIPGFSAEDVQTALEQIVKAMQDVTQGSVTDGSITLAKLAWDVIAVLDGKQELTSTLTAMDNWQMLPQVSTGAYFPMNFSGTDYRVSFATMMQALKNMMLGNKSIATAQLKDAVVTSEKLAALAVLATHIAAGAVTGQKIADKTITAANIADGTITAALLAAGVVTAEKLSDDIPYTKFGLTADQVRTITAGTADPTGGNDGDIYIQYSE